MRQEEVRRRGKPSCAKRPMTQEEFRNALKILSSNDSHQFRYRYTTMLKYQYHLIARGDDISKFHLHDIEGHADVRYRYFALQTKVRWSKNVFDERDCPDQLFLGSMDVDYCILLALAVYLESWLETAQSNKIFLFGDDVDLQKTPTRIKDTYSRALKKELFDNQEFTELPRHTLGVHSLRKYAASWSRSNGCTADEIEGRGRWKRHCNRIVDKYIDVEQEYIDAKVAAVLCVGGPIKYVLVQGSNVTNAWCEEFVVPSITRNFPCSSTVKIVLSLPLLWACFEESIPVPDSIKSRILLAYESIRQLDQGVNPVKRVLLQVFRVQDQLRIEEIMTVDEASIAVGGGEDRTLSTFNALMIQQHQLKQLIEVQQEHVQTSLESVRKELSTKFNVINKNLNRIIIQPPRQANRAQTAAHAGNGLLDAAIEARVLTAELSPHPKTLFALWQEYTSGIGGRKAAKDFTPSERGHNKVRYCRRKVIWDCIAKHVNAGYTAPVAIDRIHDCYGRSSTVSQIQNAMIKDKRRGGHPNLAL